MPPNFNPWERVRIELNDARPRVGIRVQPLTVEYSFRSGERKPFGLVFFWPRPIPYSTKPWSLNYFQIQAWHGPNLASPFLGREKLAEVFREFGRESIPYTPRTLDENDFLVAKIDGPGDILLQFRLDTEDSAFIRRAVEHYRNAPGSDFELKFHVRAFDQQQPDEAREVALLLSSPKRPPWDNGLVGIDLGHSGTALAWMSSAGESSAAIRMLNAVGEPTPKDIKGDVNLLGVLQPNASPAESNLQLTHIDASAKTTALNRARWRIGLRANEGRADNTFVSVKRMLAERPGSGPDGGLRERRVVAYKVAYKEGPTDREEEQRVSPHLPAELFFCRLFQRFREANRTTVRQFAVTYPTTFNRRELEQVREAAFKGWLRMTEQLNDQPIDLEIDERVKTHFPLALDEASAAGFFFLHRKVFERPHGLAAFRYLYPDGFNLLLFDCGGGTIDIGLLRAEVLEHPTKVKISVIGRSGMRSFGGDNITEGVFRILKAQLAAVISQMRASGQRGGGPLQFPTNSAELTSWLDGNADRINDLLPTRFNPDDLQDQAARRRRDITQDLWIAAENLKHKLVSEKTTSFAFQSNSPLGKYLARSLPSTEMAQLEGRMRSIQVQRAWVDAVIGREVVDSVQRCNHLIAKRLTEEGREVHCVVASGNGTRYPLFKEEMERRLAVPFLAERLEKFPLGAEADQKGSVAKGVVLALASSQYATNVEVEFDRTVCDRIPFDLAYKDRYRGQFVPLLHEHHFYSELADGSEPMEVQIKEGADNVVLLYRRWPGESEFWPYLVYRFPFPPSGAVTVRYDSHEHRFVVRSSDQEADLILEVVEDMKEQRLYETLASGSLSQATRSFYYSPMQRGSL